MTCDADAGSTSEIEISKLRRMAFEAEDAELKQHINTICGIKGKRSRIFSTSRASGQRRGFGFTRDTLPEPLVRTRHAWRRVRYGASGHDMGMQSQSVIHKCRGEGPRTVKGHTVCRCNGQAVSGFDTLFLLVKSLKAYGTHDSTALST
eukprot:6475730-Amphidinium_carterae.3